ncbi:hypothetical protein Tco_0590223 [Tanacetum coccineum]
MFSLCSASSLGIPVMSKGDHANMSWGFISTFSFLLLFSGDTSLVDSSGSRSLFQETWRHVSLQGMSPRTMATPVGVKNLRSECIVEAIAPSYLMPGHPNITVNGIVMTPRGHSTFPANPTKGDVGDQINALSSLVSCWKQCSYIICVELPPSTYTRCMTVPPMLALIMSGSSPLQCFRTGSSSENAILVSGGDASGRWRIRDHYVLIINISFVSLGSAIFCFQPT